MSALLSELLLLTSWLLLPSSIPFLYPIPHSTYVKAQNCFHQYFFVWCAPCLLLSFTKSSYTGLSTIYSATLFLCFYIYSPMVSRPTSLRTTFERGHFHFPFLSLLGLLARDSVWILSVNITYALQLVPSDQQN